MDRIIPLVGIVFFLLVAFLVSKDRNKIRLRPIVVMLAIQITLGFILLRSNIGLSLLSGLASIFEILLSYAHEGTRFVFGDLVDNNSIFFVTSLMPIVFISALLGILNYLKILPFIIKWVGLGLSKISGLGKLESYVGVAAMVLGQTEIFLSIKDFMDDLPPNRLYAMCAPAMSSVSMGIVGAYMLYLDPKYVLAAIPLNLFGVFVIESIIYPYELKEEDDQLIVKDLSQKSFFGVVAEYIKDGFDTAVGVAAQLIGFTALIFLINGIFNGLIGISFQEIAGYIFSPIAFLMGVPWAEAVQGGSVIATKIVTNEFVAMLELNNLDFSNERTLAIMSTFLISFANFSSIGIITGAVSTINKKQGDVVASFGLKLLLGSTLVSCLTASTIALVF
ncbi:Nucleoside permease NupC [Jeotgalibaca dankookensis]|uniref:Nucleoside permease NupC n=1 Tax=Jeotgalibaca dankookensis TaxID=708126 RepID=A0A1S6IRZ1_9LACT|nr:nucleoside transporter C-terminal domain-containing protein [Jeotgalibaca dankookensis]AQS54289.1 Nucleoside permease NupC [Jeotgalibaca dankookensis]